MTSEVTYADLKALHALHKEIECDRVALASIRNKCDYVSVIGLGGIKKTIYADELERLEMRIEERVHKSFELYHKILDFIDTLDDALLRLALSLRFINGLSWDQVAAHIGGGNSSDGIRKYCDRFMRKVFPDYKKK